MCKLCDNIDDYSMNPRIESWCGDFHYTFDWEGSQSHYGNPDIGEVSAVIDFYPECGRDLRKV